MKPLRVGLTGGLASGKSTVARWLGEAGCQVVDADQLVAELYAPGAAGARAVERLFGPRYLQAGGAVDKGALAQLVFADAAALQQLEAALHPLVRAEFARRAAPGGIIVLEATRLVEAGFAADFDLVVTVEAPAELRLERAATRGLTRDEALRRLTAQGDGAERRQAASWTLRNAGSLGELRAEVDRLVEHLRRLAAG